MEKKTISIIIGVVVVVLCFPLLPKLIAGLNERKPLSDDEKMAQIRQSIDRYRAENSQYPGTLDALAPEYLASVPKNAAGQDFKYSARTGTVTNPAQAAAQRQGGAGVTPMTDAVTGLSVNEELNF